MRQYHCFIQVFSNFDFDVHSLLTIFREMHVYYNVVRLNTLFLKAFSTMRRHWNAILTVKGEGTITGDIDVKI